MSGAGKYLKAKFRGCATSAVDPEGSVYLDYFKTGKLVQPHVYKVEGIGEDMLCKAMGLLGSTTTSAASTTSRAS